MKRTVFLAGSATALLAPGAAFAGDTVVSLRHIEAGTGGRLGVGILDMETGRRTGYRENERFPMCSTFKVLLVAAVCSSNADLKRPVAYSIDDLLEYAPVTRKNVRLGHMTLSRAMRARSEIP